MIKEQIKQEIDKCIDAETKHTIAYIQKCYDLLLPYIQDKYENSRYIIQFSIQQFERIPIISCAAQFKMAIDNLHIISNLFSSSEPDWLDYINIEWNHKEIRFLLEKIKSLLPKESFGNKLYTEVTNNLTEDERRKYVGFILDSTHRNGLKTRWNKDIIENTTLNCIVLYSICKKDYQMNLFLSFYYNLLDRINSSSEHQLARDIAENLLMIGYNENLQAESYYGACRCYTAAHNPLAGLLYLNIALNNLAIRRQPIPQQFAFDILWQVLKIMRELQMPQEEYISFVTTEFEKLNCDEYKKLSFYHTTLSLRVASRDKSAPSKIFDFLNENRELIFKNIKHSAMPWLTLLHGIHEIFPALNFPGLQLYEDTLKAAVEEDGNEMFLNLYENKELASHLKELLVKLNSTREHDDYSKDNQTALLLAKRVLSQAVQEENPSNYILAMQPKTDFTFVLPSNTQTGMYQKVNIEDVDGKDCKLFYQEIEKLEFSLQMDNSDAAMWIDKGDDSFYNMILLQDMYRFDTLKNLNEITLEDIQQNTIDQLRYSKEDKKHNAPIYCKSEYDLKAEGEFLYKTLENCFLPIPEVAARIFFMKDLEISHFPHQLFVDNRNNLFVGECRPTANVISTELFFKTNFKEPLHKDFSKAFWIPTDSGEFTFQVILSKLEEAFQKYKIDIHCESSPITPLHSDLNIICAHGANNISETEWFYANGKPLIETNSIIGKGKLLILLVCHSGTITQSFQDNAMHTIIKRYIQMGYSSVIAPMWSLATDIIPKWLSTFLKYMEAEDYVVDAVFKANMQVKDEFIAPSAWACLHLFGNPYLQICDKPRIEILEKGKN